MSLNADLSLYERNVSRADRERMLGQRGCLVWLTGLSGSGKSTIARELQLALHREGKLSFVLDGDNIRRGLNSDLGFSVADRHENIRRIGEVAALFVETGIIVLTAFISPFRADRDRVRKVLGEERFLEVFVDAPLAACEARDPKGLYRKARAGAISEFTGITSPYEAPTAPAVTLRTAEATVGECVAQIRTELDRRSLLNAGAVQPK